MGVAEAVERSGARCLQLRVADVAGATAPGHVQRARAAQICVRNQQRRRVWQPSPPVRPAPQRPGRVATRRMRQATARARAPVVLAALEDWRVQLKLLNLRVALDGPCVLSCESLIRGVLVDCGPGDGSGRGVPRQQQSSRVRVRWPTHRAAGP